MSTPSSIKSILLALIFMATHTPVAEAQNTNSLTLEIIRGLSNYRTELLKRNPQYLGHLVKLMEIMKANIPDEEAYWDFLNEMSQLAARDSATSIKEVKKLNVQYPHTSFLKAFTYDDFRAISRSHEILFLFGFGTTSRPHQEYPRILCRQACSQGLAIRVFCQGGF